MTKYVLRPLETSDYDDVARWLADPTEFADVCGNAFDYPLKRDAFIECFVTRPQTVQDRLCYIWCESNSHNACGMISYSRIDWKNDYGHIGFVAVAPELRSRGIGKAMVEAMLRLGFEEHGFHRIDLVVLEENAQARDFYENKLGFTVEGRMRDVNEARWQVRELAFAEYSERRVDAPRVNVTVKVTPVSFVDNFG